jgi:ribosomal protein S20
MAITSSAKKAHRASLRKHVFNVRRKRAMTSTVKDARKAGGAVTKEQLAAAFQAIDKATKRGIIRKTPLRERKHDS